MIRAYLLDGNEGELQQLALQLRQTGVFDVIGMSVKADEAITEMIELCPDVLFVEMQLRGFHGIHVIERVRQQQPNIQIVIVSQDPRFALLAFEHQVADYVLKPLDAERLRKTIDRLRWN